MTVCGSGKVVLEFTMNKNKLTFDGFSLKLLFLLKVDRFICTDNRFLKQSVNGKNGYQSDVVSSKKCCIAHCSTSFQHLLIHFYVLKSVNNNVLWTNMNNQGIINISIFKKLSTFSLFGTFFILVIKFSTILLGVSCFFFMQCPF